MDAKTEEEMTRSSDGSGSRSPNTELFSTRRVGDVLFAKNFPAELRSMLTTPTASALFEASSVLDVISDSPGSPNRPAPCALPQTTCVDPNTGAQKRQKPLRYDLIPVEAMAEVALLYGLGARLYAERNWEKGYKWSLSYAALRRHAELFWTGENWDADGGHHLAAVVFHALAMMQFDLANRHNDDRPIYRKPDMAPVADTEVGFTRRVRTMLARATSNRLARKKAR